jgi:PKD repeat protein
MSFRQILNLCLLASFLGFIPAEETAETAEAQSHTRRNFYGMHNLKDGGASIPEGMNWTRHLVGEGGYVFDWVRGDYGRWVVDAMDRNLIPCLRIQNCNGGCDPDAGYAEIVATIIREHLETYRPEYLNRLIYLQLWNEPGDPRDYVTPERFAEFLVEANAGVKRADVNGVFRTMTPGQNGPEWWRRAIRHNPAVCQAFDVWATHPYPESYPPHYNHHDGVPYINQVKTIDSYLLDLDAVASECEAQGSPRRGFPVMITETAYGDHLGISYEGYPKTTRGPACTTDGPCEYGLASQYNVAAFTEYWHKWPEILAVHPFILNNWSWDHFAFVSRGSGSRSDGVRPDWCPPEDIAAATPWPPNYNEGARRCGLPEAPYPQYKALLDIPKPPPARLEPYRGPVGAIRGRVRRADDGSPVGFATVFTDGYEFGGPTLSDGIYVVRDVPVGDYTLGVEKVGYETRSTSVRVEAGVETAVDFDLVYTGVVSRGIYFQNQGTCSNCDLFAPYLGESFVVPDDVGFVKFAAAMPNVGNVTMQFSILEDGPTGARVGQPVMAYLQWGGEMIGAEWPGNGVPVEPGRTYFLKVERADGAFVYLYATDANPYAEGMAYTGTTSHPGWDLFATIRGQTQMVNVKVGTLTGSVQDVGNQPLQGAVVRAESGASTTSGADGRYALSLPEGAHLVSATLDGYVSAPAATVTIQEGQTAVHDFTLQEDVTPPPPPPPDGALVNGDFSRGLEGWSVWTERGELGPVTTNGTVQLVGPGHNGGLYQQFQTGGAGSEITIDGFWESRPSVANAQWAEVLVIDGPRSPANGRDLNASEADVVMIYKNDTWASPSGWSGDMRTHAPVATVGSFIASGNVATIVLKSGNLPGVNSGVVFDDMVVRSSRTPPPSNQPPTAHLVATPISGNAPLDVSFDASSSSDPDGDGLSFQWSFGDGTSGIGASVGHRYEGAGTYSAVVTVDDGRGGTDQASVTIEVSPTPSVDNLIANGDFTNGLAGWSFWRERGSLAPTVDGGRAHLAGEGHNAGLYQQFATGGAGREITVEGFWASAPTAAAAQWAEVLVIDGPGSPVDGQDLNGSQPNVILLHKRDTWTSPSGWSGAMGQARFVASSDVATIVLKSGNLPGANTGTLFDDVLVRASGAAPPPPDTPPGVAEWDERLTTLGLQVAEADVPPGTSYWKLLSARYESDGEILPPPGGGSESGGTHAIYVRALDPNSSALEGQTAIVTWPGGGEATVQTKGAADQFWGNFPMAGGWCPFYPDGPRGPYSARMADGASDEVRGMGMPCNRHVSYRFVWKWTQKDSGKSKLSIHAGFGGPLSMAFVRDAKPRILKILDTFSAAPEVKRLSPETEIVGRAFLSSQPMDGDPRVRAREWWDRTKGIVLQYPDVDYWEGYNEPVIQTPELMEWYAAFEAERVHLLADSGRRACIGNFSVGNPDLPLWPQFYAAIDAAMGADGILGLHEYGTPMQQYFDEASGEGWFTGRYRKLYRQHLIPAGKVIPLAITETGVDVVPPVGWKNHFIEEEYLAQLEWYDSVLREDDYVLGATIFALEIPGWYSFDIAPIVERLADYVAAP